MITSYHVAKHADAIVELLRSLSKLLGLDGRPADAAIAIAQGVLAAITDEQTPSDPTAIRKIVADLQASLAVNDAAADAALKAKFAATAEEKEQAATVSAPAKKLADR